MSQYKAKVINLRNTSKDFESFRFKPSCLEADLSNHEHNNQGCENCLNENGQKKETCTYCCSLKKPKEIHQTQKTESPKRDYDTNKLSKLNIKENDHKSQYNWSSRGFSIDSISLESYDSAEKVAMRLYCKECADVSRFRIIQNKLVYISGLAPEIASEKVLQKPEYLGQYGKIAKILVNNNHNGACCTACVVYCKEDEALTAILALDQFNLFDKTIRACSGNLLCCLNPFNNDLPYICAGGCIDLNLLERDSELDPSKSLKSVQQITYTPRLQHILCVLSKQPNEQKIEESVFPSISCIIQNIKKILSDISKNEEQTSLNLRAEEKEGDSHATKMDSKPVRKSLRLPDRKSENPFSYLPILEKIATSSSKDRELACTETMTVVSNTETCETNRSKNTENDTDVTINENDEEDIIPKEFESESPLKHSHSEFKLNPEDLTIKRFISGTNNEDSARNSLAGSQRFDLLGSPSKSLIEEENEPFVVDIDRKISEGISEKSRERNVSRFSFAQPHLANEDAEFEALAFSIKKQAMPFELNEKTEEFIRICESETIQPSHSYFDIGEKPMNSIKISENEQNVQQIEAFLHKLNKPSSTNSKHFNPNANNFIPIPKSKLKKPVQKQDPRKVSPSSEISVASKKKVATLNSSLAALPNTNHLKSGKINKINTSYYETTDNSYYPYYLPSVYEAELQADIQNYMQDWTYLPPIGAMTLSYPDLYFLPYY